MVLVHGGVHGGGSWWLVVHGGVLGKKKRTLTQKFQNPKSFFVLVHHNK